MSNGLINSIFQVGNSLFAPQTDPQSFVSDYAQPWKPPSMGTDQPSTRPTIDWSTLPKDTPDSVKGMIAMADIWRPMMNETREANKRDAQELLTMQNAMQREGFQASLYGGLQRDALKGSLMLLGRDSKIPNPIDIFDRWTPIQGPMV